MISFLLPKVVQSADDEQIIPRDDDEMDRRPNCIIRISHYYIMAACSGVTMMIFALFRCSLQMIRWSLQDHDGRQRGGEGEKMNY